MQQQSTSLLSIKKLFFSIFCFVLVYKGQQASQFCYGFVLPNRLNIFYNKLNIFLMSIKLLNFIFSSNQNCVKFKSTDIIIICSSGLYM
jgi:hypothetical protein